MSRLSTIVPLLLAACAHAPVHCGPSFLFDAPAQLSQTVALDGHVIPIPDGAVLQCSEALE